MIEPGVTTKAGGSSRLPSTATRPSSIQRSASRREHRPARASTVAIRSPFFRSPFSGPGPVSSLMLSSLRRGDEGAENRLVGRADLEFGMPLHAQAEAPARQLDPFDD